MHSSEYKQVPTGQDGPSGSYGTQRVAIERESNPALQKQIMDIVNQIFGTFYSSLLLHTFKFKKSDPDADSGREG